jgi:hypothetical protein
MSHLSEEKLDELVAAERERQQPPLNDWRTIAARAREEGLIRESSSGGWASGQPWMRAAAAVLLLIGGIAIGRTTIGLPSASDRSSAENGSASQSTAPTAGEVSFASVEDATASLDRAARDYERASRFLAANNTSVSNNDSSAIYTARLAALDQVVNATENALQKTAPHDPVINQYYLATMGARVATQQMVARPVLGLKGF